MTERVLVVGGVAAGMSAASQAKRRRPDLDVVVLERGADVSYGACGIPYNVADASRRIDDLVVLSAPFLRGERGLDVRTRHEAVVVDVERRVLRAANLEAGPDIVLTWDRLVLACGARAVRPPLPGLDLPGVFVVRELSDGAALKRYLVERPARRGVVLGGGYVGLEMAEALRRRGLEVTVLEKLDQVVPGLDPSLAAQVREELDAHEVKVALEIEVSAFERAPSGSLVVRTGWGDLAADVVIVAVGLRPEVELARRMGVALGETGAIAVDPRQETSVPGVFAAGDCAEARHLVTGRPAWVPLGTTANKQGRVAGANAAGGDQRFPGIVGTAAFKVFGFEVARTGLSPAEAGPGAVVTTTTHRTRGHAYPGGGDLTTLLVAEAGSGRLLGAQCVGPEGAAARINVLAAALYGRMGVEDLAAFDLAYAPPFAPVWDPLLVAANAARKAFAE